jgi:hypothetical protein
MPPKYELVGQTPRRFPFCRLLFFLVGAISFLALGLYKSGYKPGESTARISDISQTSTSKEKIAEGAGVSTDMSEHGKYSVG